VKIVTCYESTKQHLSQIRTALLACGSPDAKIVVADQQSVGEHLLDADIFLGHVKGPVDWEAVVAAGRLRWMQSSAAGLDHCLTPPVAASNILVSSASGLFANQVAEQTLALLLGLIRRLKLFFLDELKKKYRRLPTDDLHGKTVGIVGLGGNGQRIAQLLRSLGCKIIGTDLFAEQQLEGVSTIFPPHDLQRVLRQANCLILTVPLTTNTRHLITAKELSLLPRASYLINVARGAVVRESDLLPALQSGHLAGVGLDVAEIEPLPPSSPLWLRDDVILTPHVGAQSQTRNDDVTWLFCQNLHRFCNSQVLWNQVDKQLGFPTPQTRLPAAPPGRSRDGR